ncbi:putative MFS family arabinose efflux permease [Haloactinopolyspora alba]|uniref:Putative MFS family arabinose efflux permease n=1 Tax=Haloactinopolyspora alba TaxID=648780 RepID=A0A2P8DVF7_9ACTN|nr:MFS transporter [Haloactinopolyspora alba]PSL01196.1 putative MFS family arabinose efflux permease [Haloactinopolyspora alba]
MSAWRVPGFRRLGAAWTFSNFGDSALILTLGIWAKDLTGSNAAAGLVFLALGLPVFLAPFAGHVADRVSRRRLVVVVDVVAAVGVLALLFVRSADQLWLIYVVTFGYGCVGYLTSAAQSGLLRDMLVDDELAGANGVLSTIDQGLRLLTPLVGAGLYTVYGGGAVAVLTSSALVIAALVMLTVCVDETPPSPSAEREHFVREVAAGARHIRTVPGLARTVVLVGIAFAATGFGNSTTFAVIDDGLELGSEFFGVLASIQGCGSVLGGLTAAWVIRRLGEHATIGVGLALIAAGFATGLVPSVAVVGTGSAVLGLGVVWMVVGLVTLRQRLTPARLQGRVSAATTMAFNGPQTVGIATGAALIAAVDYRILVAVMAGAVAACAVLLVLRAGRSRSLDGVPASAAVPVSADDVPADEGSARPSDLDRHRT